MITLQDLVVVRGLLDAYRTKPTIQAVMSEGEYVARQLGDISRGRAQRLIIAARQGIATRDLPRRRVRR